MAKVTAAMKGVFKEMLEDYLHLVEKSGAKAARTGGTAAEKAAGKAGAAAAKQVEVPFKLSPRMKEYGDEMARQLDRQLAHFDGMTAGEVVKAMEHPVARGGAAQREAREQFSKKILQRQNALMSDLAMSDPKAFSSAMKDMGLKQTDDVLADAERLAKARTDGFMGTVAALHEPDIVAGGKDVIGTYPNGWESFGDAGVNSSIGSQWKSLKPDLLDTLRGMDPNTPITLTHSIR